MTHSNAIGPAGAEALQIGLIEANASVRDGVVATLASRGYRVRSFGSAEEYLTTDEAGRIDCLLIGYRLPGMSSLELQRRLTAGPDAPPIVAMSDPADVPAAVRLLDGGAISLVQTPFRAEELAAVVARAIDWGAVRRRVANRFVEIGASVERLSPREKTVLQAIVAGQLNKAIAKQLDVSVRTVEGDRAKIVNKFGADTTGEVVGKYAEYQLLAECGKLIGLNEIAPANAL